MALGKRIGPQQHHGARFRHWQRISNAHRMRSDQIHLQLPNLVTRNPHVAQFAHAGGDGIRHLVSLNDVLDHRPRRIHKCACVRREQHRAALNRDLAHRFERQIVSVNVKGFHKSSF